MEITLRILDGADRGRVYSELPTPVTIGREEGNTIQLNDERVSRYHVKIQEEKTKYILTDLDSTNGTKVNGDDIRLRILRFGDLITVGRSLILFGSEDQIAGRLAGMRQSEDMSLTSSGGENGVKAASLDFELNWREDPEVQAALHSLEMPELPEGLSPGQAAQLSEVLEYVHLRIRDLLSTVHLDEEEMQAVLDIRAWQNLLDLDARLSASLRRISEPPDAID